MSGEKTPLGSDELSDSMSASLGPELRVGMEAIGDGKIGPSGCSSGLPRRSDSRRGLGGIGYARSIVFVLAVR